MQKLKVNLEKHKTLPLGPNQSEHRIGSGARRETQKYSRSTMLSDEIPKQQTVEPLNAPDEYSIESILSGLPKLFSSSPGEKNEVIIEKKLGEGGMGEVWQGKQSTLHREVAVKKLRFPENKPSMLLKLLKEAWITGQLEHPNVVPVHVLGLDEDGSPAFAMKRINGFSWKELLTGQRELPEGLQGSTTLEKHIRILKQVCNALHFAHSKGIIHRDLKPENVMIGEFGEVYLVDWGIAIHLSQLAQKPRSKKNSVVHGTPMYMAPEMAAGEEGRLGVTTDVYLLGATLHEVLTGEPPHTGDTIYQILINAVHSKPQKYDESIPPELAEICLRAMHKDPKQRYPDAEAFRKALANYLTHMSSHQIRREATSRLQQLRQHLKCVEKTQREDVEEIYQLFGQIHFGFQHALRTWQDNVAASEGLQEALELMIHYELEKQHIRAASTLLAQLPKPNDELAQLVAEKNHSYLEQQAKFEALAHLSQELDLSIQAQPRSYLMICMAWLWGGLPLFMELLYDLGWYVETARDDLLLSGVRFLGSFLCLWWWRSLWRTRLNRNLLMALGLAMVTMFLFWIMGLRLGLSLPKILALESLPMFGFFAFIATLVDQRLRSILWLYGVILLFALWKPQLAPYGTGLGNIIAFLLAGWIWHTNHSEQTLQAHPAPL